MLVESEKAREYAVTMAKGREETETIKCTSTAGGEKADYVPELRTRKRKVSETLTWLAAW